MLHAFKLGAYSIVVLAGAMTVAPELATPPDTGAVWVMVGRTGRHVVQTGDTLRALAARYGIETSAIAADNGLTRDATLAAGSMLQINARHVARRPTPPGSLLINVPQRMLYFEAPNTQLFAYPIAVGRPTWQTPASDFSIVSLELNPTWDVPASILEESRRTGRVQPPRVGPGPDNPLGAYWIGLSIPGIGIHGTNAPSSIFQAATHGCIRMGPSDIADLFARVVPGMRGRIVYEPLLLTLEDGRVYLEAHRDIYRRGTAGVTALRRLADAQGLAHLIDWTKAEYVLGARHGVARDVTVVR